MRDADLTFFSESASSQLASGNLALDQMSSDVVEIWDAPVYPDMPEIEELLTMLRDKESLATANQFTFCVEEALGDPLVARVEVADHCLAAVPVSGPSTTTVAHEAKVEDPPNPVLPAVNEIFWSAIFFLLLWGLMKYVLLPPIRKLQAQRAQKLQDDRDAAQRAEEDLASAQADYDAAIYAARGEASLLLDEARSRAGDRRAELVEAAVADVNAARSAAAEETTAARFEAVGNLRSEIRELAVDAAANVLGTRPSDTAAADRAIDELLEEARGGSNR